MKLTYIDSWTSICNIALSRIGRPDITSIGEDTEDAALCRLHLPDCVAFITESADWSFLRKIENLPIKSSAIENVFELPADLARIVAVEMPAPYQRLGNELHTKSPFCTITYIGYPENPSVLPSAFKNAISSYLAYRISLVLTGDQNLSQIIYSETSTYISQALLNDRSDLLSKGNESWEEMQI